MPFYQKYTLEQVLDRQINIKIRNKIRRKITRFIVMKLIPKSFREYPIQELMELQQGARIGHVAVHYDVLEDGDNLDIKLN